MNKYMSRVVTKIAMKGIASGLRMPRSARFESAYQHGRTLDEMVRRQINVVLDVGANRGHYARHLRMLGYSGHILSFEPDPDTFRQLKVMAKGDALWWTFNAALGSVKGSMDFNVVDSGGETVLSSFLRPIGDFPTRIVGVDVSTVRDALHDSRLPADPRVFLKMDTQGYDLEVFAGAMGVSTIVMIQSEVSVIPIYEEMPSYLDALATYHAAGFSLLDLFIVHRTAGGGVLEYDALLAQTI